MAVLQVAPAGEVEEMFEQIGGSECVEQRVMWREIRALLLDDWQDVERGDDFLQLVGRKLRIGLAGQRQRVEPWAEVVERECLTEDGVLCWNIVCDKKMTREPWLEVRPQCDKGRRFCQNVADSGPTARRVWVELMVFRDVQVKRA